MSSAPPQGPGSGHLQPDPPLEPTLDKTNKMAEVTLDGEKYVRYSDWKIGFPWRQQSGRDVLKPHGTTDDTHDRPRTHSWTALRYS
ncbi:hypothetical protein N7470_001016 [Penicillium chermesinum]|nr:hypothetical protein N7470_001016 [Penicillium chermesinum]